MLVGWEADLPTLAVVLATTVPRGCTWPMTVILSIGQLLCQVPRSALDRRVSCSQQHCWEVVTLSTRG